MRAAVANPAVTVVDVLSREAFATGRLPGAINIPFAELRTRAGAELPDRSRDIVVYCGGPT